MNDNELMFDDWAMYLANCWRDQNEPRSSNSRDHFRSLLTHLCYLLQYDVPRHRYAYPVYITLRFDEPHRAALLRISHYIAVHRSLLSTESEITQDIFEVELFLVEHVYLQEMTK